MVWKVCHSDQPDQPVARPAAGRWVALPPPAAHVLAQLCCRHVAIAGAAVAVGSRGLKAATVDALVVQRAPPLGLVAQDGQAVGIWRQPSVHDPDVGGAPRSRRQSEVVGQDRVRDVDVRHDQRQCGPWPLTSGADRRHLECVRRHR
eukprot:scaffold3265_cov63-Phaeocystis_antarctica.AAC.3